MGSVGLKKSGVLFTAPELRKELLQRWKKIPIPFITGSDLRASEITPQIQNVLRA